MGDKREVSKEKEENWLKRYVVPMLICLCSSTSEFDVMLICCLQHLKVPTILSNRVSSPFVRVCLQIPAEPLRQNQTGILAVN